MELKIIKRGTFDLRSRLRFIHDDFKLGEFCGAKLHAKAVETAASVPPKQEMGKFFLFSSIKEREREFEFT